MAVNLFDMSPSEQLCALQARKIDLGFVGVRPPASDERMSALAWECVAHHTVVVVLPMKHPLAKKKEIKITDLKSLFFVAMSEETHPGSRPWLSAPMQEGRLHSQNFAGRGAGIRPHDFRRRRLGGNAGAGANQKLASPRRGFSSARKSSQSRVFGSRGTARTNPKHCSTSLIIVKKEAAAWV